MSALQRFGKEYSAISRRLGVHCSRYTDLILAGGVVLIIAMLIYPMPQCVMDVMIGVNISVAALMLLVALYVPDATRLPSFPTILLLTTLFRLAINVSTTRLILSEADAGEIIRAFGEFVVQGNYVVGAVVFLVLVLIQFIVIAKGSERVAEVSARFTLDAVPGKQMSIDADLRTGAISQEEATRRRRGLERESQLYGAMDGAMKFVKGDAIAGIVISLINVIGGLILGVLQNHLPVEQAAQRYTLLTIGDGLVSQIPALLMSVAAGLVVTRVASGIDAEEGHLAKDIFAQTLSQPRALACVSVFLFAMVAIPGFPKPVFLVLGTIMALISVSQLLIRADGTGAEHRTQPDVVRASSEPPRLPAKPVAVSVEIHSSLVPAFASDDARQRQALADDMDHMWRRLSLQMGFYFPRIRPQHIRHSLGRLQDTYSIEIFECPVAHGLFSPGQALVECEKKDAVAFGLDAEERRTPWSRMPACTIPADQIARARAANLIAFDARQVILRHLAVQLTQHAECFVGVEETGFLLDQLKQRFQHLAQAVTPTHLSLTEVTEVFQRLVKEGVSIRDLRTVMGSLARWTPTQKDPMQLAELVRRDMRRALCTMYALGRQRLNYVSLDKEIENLIEGAVHVGADGRPAVSPDPDVYRDILQAVGHTIQASGIWRQPFVVLTSASIRRYFRAMIEASYPEVPVMSYDELVPEVAPRPQGVIRLNAPEPQAAA